MYPWCLVVSSLFAEWLKIKMNPLCFLVLPFVNVLWAAHNYIVGELAQSVMFFCLFSIGIWRALSHVAYSRKVFREQKDLEEKT
jgi:hypothetical protein